MKLPHIGWNEVRFADARSSLIEELPPTCAFYHVHSFAPVPARAEDVLGTAEYGAPFASAVEKGSFYGVQFHPEKSSAAGLQLLANFARICAAARSAGRPVKLYPAIDILGGNAVRLVKGDFETKRVYDEDPLSAARGWVEEGARRLHVVDLDGAKTGELVNLAAPAPDREAGRAGSVRRRTAFARRGGRGARGGRRARDPRHCGVHRSAICSSGRSTSTAPSG